MKPYKGLITINCLANKGCPRKLLEHMQAGCMDCPHSKPQIVGLDGKLLFERERPEVLIKTKGNKTKT